jgi:hypothetical protein
MCSKCSSFDVSVKLLPNGCRTIREMQIFSLLVGDVVNMRGGVVVVVAGVWLCCCFY